MTRIITSLLAFTLIAHAGPEAWFQHGLIMPETIATLKAELELTPDQESKMQSIVSGARTSAESLEQAVKEQQKAFNEALRNRETSADAASAALARLLEAEAPVKQLQLRTLIQLRDILTPDQQKKAKSLAPGKLAKKGDLESKVKAKAEKLRAAVESLGIKATQAMTDRGGEIESMIRAGEWAQADKALDKLTLESGVNEPESTEELNFSNQDPGNVDLEVLKQRLADVQTRAQSIISLPLIRQFIKAKEALEEAKAAQNAELVGRILTWGESKLAKQ
jgi:Spy/CpxP family protein refolding chaperone